MATHQLNLNLDIRSDASLGDFTGPGWSTLMDAIRQLHVGLIRQLYVYGNPSTGKTHLLTAICESYIESGKTAICLSLQDLVHTDTAVLNALENFDLIAIDGLDAIADSKDWQEATFHLINRNLDRLSEMSGAQLSKEPHQSGQLVFSAQLPASKLPFNMPDLLTRLVHAPSFKLPDGHDITDRKALLESVLFRRGWQFDQRILDHLLIQGPHRIGQMLEILYVLQPLFSNLNRTRLPKAVINDAISMIDEQTLLTELKDIHDQTLEDNIGSQPDHLSDNDNGVLSKF